MKIITNKLSTTLTSTNITGGLGKTVFTPRKKAKATQEVLVWTDESHFLVRERRSDCTDKQGGFTRPHCGIVRHDENWLAESATGELLRNLPNYTPQYREYSVIEANDKSNGVFLKRSISAALAETGKRKLPSKRNAMRLLFKRNSGKYFSRKFVFVDYSLDEVHTLEMEEIIDYFLGKSFTYKEFMNYTMNQIHNRKGFRSKGGSDYSELEAGKRWSTWLTKQNIIKEIK